MADPNDILEKLRLARLAAIAAEKQKADDNYNSGRYSMTPANFYQGEPRPTSPSEEEGYALYQGDDAIFNSNPIRNGDKAAVYDKWWNMGPEEYSLNEPERIEAMEANGEAHPNRFKSLLKSGK